MTSEDGDRDERPNEIAMRQFRVLHHRERANVLNRTRSRRMARRVGLGELADAVEERRCYELVDRHRAESRSDDANGGG